MVLVSCPCDLLMKLVSRGYRDLGKDINLWMLLLKQWDMICSLKD